MDYIVAVRETGEDSRKFKGTLRRWQGLQGRPLGRNCRIDCEVSAARHDRSIDSASDVQIYGRPFDEESY